MLRQPGMFACVFAGTLGFNDKQLHIHNYNLPKCLCGAIDSTYIFLI